MDLTLCVFLPMLICLSFQVHLSCQQDCVRTCSTDSSDPDVWTSELVAVSLGSTSGRVTWNADNFQGREPSLYVVEFRISGSPVYSSRNETEGMSFTLTDLDPNEVYDVQVCRAVQDNERTDNCGGCTVCLETGPAQDVPSPPLGVTLSSVRSETFSVQWRAPANPNEGGIHNYSISCTSPGEPRSVTCTQCGTSAELLQVGFTRLTPNTTYNCSVIAFNRFGPSAASFDVATTSIGTEEPGALLFYSNGTLGYYDVSNGMHGETTRVLITTDDTITAMDYNFEKSVLYLTTTNSSGMGWLRRMVMDVTSNPTTGILTLTSQGDPEILHTAPMGVAYVLIAVDWLNEDIFIVETQNNQYRVMRFVNGSNMGPFCAMETAEPIRNIAVDPLNGFFYWSTDESIFRFRLGIMRSTSTSCPPSLPESPEMLTTLSSLVTFTIEPDRALYLYGSYDCTMGGPVDAVLSRRLGEVGDILYNFASSGLRLLDSFNRHVISVVNVNSRTFITSTNTENTRSCPMTGLGVKVTPVDFPVTLIRMYRSSKQPRVPPGPPMDIRITTTNNAATFTWQSPQFSASFSSSDAFSDWTYIIRICEQANPSSCTTDITKDLTIEVTSLRPSTNYFVSISISAGTQGPALSIPRQLVFRTKGNDFDSAWLLVAHESGVQRSMLSGDSVTNIGGDFSSESNAVAYDSHTGTIYWSIEGGQGNVYQNDGDSPDTAEVLYQIRDQPFSLKFDWFTRRLFWVEDGEGNQDSRREIVAPAERSSTDDPMLLNEVEGVQDTALDASEGLLFWTNHNSIMMQTLSGLPLGMCALPALQVSSLAVDVQRNRLYWLSSSTSSGQPLRVSQMDYDSTSCISNSMEAKDINGISFSSSSTVLAYGSDTLFISNRGSNVVYTISSDLGSVGDSQDMAVGYIQFSGGTPDNIRDITIASRDLQPLPSTIPVNGRSVELLQPSASSPPVLGSSSTTSNIVIEWDPPNQRPQGMPTAPLFYVVDYTLTRISGEVIMGSMTTIMETAVTLTGQQGNTNVSVNITTYSPWTRSLEFAANTFTSLPDRPAQVTNVRVFTIRPSTNCSELTGLVVWDAVSNVISYNISVTENGQPLTLYMPQFDDTSYVILQRGFDNVNNHNAVSYLESGHTYQVEITGVNSAGSGTPSEQVAFTINAPDYPEQVLAVGAEGGSQYLGSNTAINRDLSIPEAGPIVVDTIFRDAYWYSPSSHRINTRSFSNGLPGRPFLPIPEDRVLLSLAFDWVGKYLYMLRMDPTSRRLELYNLLIYDTDRLFNVFENLQDTAQEGSTFQLIMNPFTGFVYWTETTPENNTSLHQLNLRQASQTTSSTILFNSQRRKRNTNNNKRYNRRFRRQLSTLSITSALAQDPLTGELLLCDATSGNIYRCNLENMLCSVVVERSLLQLPGGGTVSGDAGLPATSLTWNENRLHWARQDSPGVYAVDFSATTTLIVVSSTELVSSITTLSPDQQMVTFNQTCLSPMFIDINRRLEFLHELFIAMNTSILLVWDVAVPLPDTCDPVAFSIPPYTYRVTYDQGVNPPPLFLMYTRRTCFNFTDLEPFDAYNFNVAIANEFTYQFFPGQHFEQTSRNTTSEGVPAQPTGLQHTVTGTASVNLTWDTPSREQLRGPVGSVQYIVEFENGQVENAMSNPYLILENSTRLTRGETNLIKVFLNNGVLTGPSQNTIVNLWPLVPAPSITNITNNSFIATISILDSDGFQNILLSVACLACDYEAARVVESNCFCPFDSISMGEEDFIMVNSFPFNFEFNMTGLTAHTRYCVQAVGNYTSEVTPGIGHILRTDSGIPGAPNIMLVGSTLMWTPPTSNGSPITSYEVLLRIANTDTNQNATIFPEVGTEFHLNEGGRLSPDTLYSVTVRALNMIGPGPESEVVLYTRLPVTTDPPSTTQTPFLGLPGIIGISVAGVAVIAIIAITVIIICFLQCHCRSSSRKLPNLSYMYGPDHELSNLRDAYRNAQSSNPHYTWSREDYVCTDEDLSLLNKFPRNNLKLENFIDRGEFGEVFQGTATDILGVATGPTPVAVKTLRKGSTPEEQNKFLSEAALMANFNHPNIVKVLGVCVDNDPVYIIMELMPGGDLLKFLREAKMDHGPTLLTQTEQIQIAVDVAQGCHYLEQQHFIHRDIAARNCLVSSKGSDRVVKIGDFGLAKDLYSSDYYQVEGQRKLPVRWMAPEALLQGKFTVESDIWSFGVLLWEIMTLGNQPYPGRINQEVLQFVTGGGRLDRPDKCPSKIYHLMQNCWKRYTSDRPHFEPILNILTSFMNRLKNTDSIYCSDSETDEEGEGNPPNRQGSGKQPARASSFRGGIINLARSGSMKLRNSFRRHNSLHKREHDGASSQPDENGSAFRERGPF